jgi:hypothetical protein
MEWNPRGRPALPERQDKTPAATSDRRAEERYSAEGEVLLSFDDPMHQEIRGNLLDYSRSGFRALHGHRELRNGQLVGFRHEVDRGQARVIWNRILGPRVETGFLVI